MINVPTTISQSTLDALGELIREACDSGDTVSAIAERAGVDRESVSRLRNGTFRNSPTIERVDLILNAIGEPTLGESILQLRKLKKKIAKR